MDQLPIDMTDAIKGLPRLYRGDQAVRACRTTGQSLMIAQYRTHGLYSNLICSGNPLAVQRNGIRSTVSQHILGWPQSHYLSFSEDYAVAEVFARGYTGKTLSPTHRTPWDAVIFSFQPSKFTWSIKSIGIYVGVAPCTALPYLNGVTQVALIDCVTLLASLVAAGQTQYTHELALARYEKEWLIIPIDPLPPGPLSHIGYSAQLQPGLVTGDHYDLI